MTRSTRNPQPATRSPQFQSSSNARVAVLMGGPSGEHDVSLRSGQGVVEALTRRGWTPEAVVIPKRLSTAEACAFTRQALQRCEPDVAFLALHGTFGEDGTIQQLCEELRIDYTGSNAAASRLGMDKISSRKLFERAGLAVPKWQAVHLGAGRRLRLSKDISYPLVVKPAAQGSSLGISIVRESAALPAAVAEASQYGPEVVIEEFIAGRELTVGVLGEAALPAIEIRPSRPFFDFSAKYTAGATQYLVPAPVEPPVLRILQAATLTAHRALGCRHLSRTDIILTPKGSPVILEVNTIPGFTATSLLPKAAACVNISYDELCEQLVVMASRRLAQPAAVCPA